MRLIENNARDQKKNKKKEKKKKKKKKKEEEVRVHDVRSWVRAAARGGERGHGKPSTAVRCGSDCAVCCLRTDL